MSESAIETGGTMPPPPPMPVVCDVCRKHGSAGEEGFAEIADILNFEPVPRRTQVNNWTPELQRAFVAALAITGSERRAGKAIGRHEYGAQKLRKARGGRAFDEACEAALQIYRDREMVRLSDQMSELKTASLEQVQKMDLKPGEGDGDEAPGYGEVQEAQARIQDRLLRGRRLYLFSICNNAKKREAWEKLCGPVDWAKAVKLEPQENEPYPARMVKPDMLLTAEGGCLPEMTPGCRDRGKEFIEAMDEIKQMTEANPAARLDGPKARRFFDGDVPGEEA
ncbi:MAG: hypothetical protein ACTHN4_02910 [Sphingomicrobium sp.]